MSTPIPVPEIIDALKKLFGKRWRHGFIQLPMETRRRCLRWMSKQ